MGRLLASGALLGLLLGACGATPKTERERRVELARVQRLVIVLGACAGTVAADGAASRSGSGRASQVAGYVALGTCLVAGGVSVFGLPAFAEPELPAEALPQDELNREPAEPAPASLGGQ